MPRPSPVQLDSDFREYRRLLSIAEQDAKHIRVLKDRLVKLCKKHGIAPPKASKTLRLEGIEFFADATFGISTSYDQDRIAAIATKLRDLGYPATFAAQRLFDSVTTYSLRPAWRDAIFSLPNSRHKKVLLALLNGVTKCTPRHPSLSVKPRTVRAGFREYKTAAKRGAR